MSQMLNTLRLPMRYADAALAAGIVMLVIMMVIPLPAWLLDVLLVTNLSLALLALLMTLNVRQALDFSVFPTLLLIATLFRLALNVTSTRLILLQGYAGQVIQQFGQFVVGGNPVVGFVVFAILIIIQFIVITRGAERVAEVAARFTLDAMPGRQMSIDADLNAGVISEDEARRRREEIGRQADFYGAMDGASKFIKGDAIASIIITLVNIVGGFIVGVAQRGLPVFDALHQYTLLTIGDGLITQIPALLLSTAAGVVVTRAASETHFGHDVSAQLFSEPRVLSIAAAVMFLLALVPGLPAVPFILLAVLFGFIGWQSRLRPQQTPEPETAATESAAAPPDAQAELTHLLHVDPLEIELGYGLLPLADQHRDGQLLQRIALIRRQMAEELGIVLPLIRVRDHGQLPPNDYIIRLRGAKIGQATLMPHHYLAMDPGTAEGDLAGIETTEPAFGLKAWWIDASQREQAELNGYTVVDAATVLATHLTRLVRLHAHQLLGRQETRELLDIVREQAPALVDELLPDLLKIGDIQKVLRNLLREGVPIRDLPTILETLADRAGTTRDPDVLTEYVRQALGPQLASLLPIKDGVLRVRSFDADLEQKLTNAIKRNDDATFLALAPDEAERLVTGIAKACELALQAGDEPVILAPPLVRLHVRRLIETTLPDVPVIGFGELPAAIQVVSVGVITLED